MGYFRKAQFIYALVVFGILFVMYPVYCFAKEWYSVANLIGVLILLASSFIINKYFVNKFNIQVNQFLNTLDYETQKLREQFSSKFTLAFYHNIANNSRCIFKFRHFSTNLL